MVVFSFGFPQQRLDRPNIIWCAIWRTPATRLEMVQSAQSGACRSSGRSSSALKPFSSQKIEPRVTPEDIPDPTDRKEIPAFPNRYLLRRRVAIRIRDPGPEPSQSYPCSMSAFSIQHRIERSEREAKQTLGFLLYAPGDLIVMQSASGLLKQPTLQFGFVCCQRLRRCSRRARST